MHRPEKRSLPDHQRMSQGIGVRLDDHLLRNHRRFRRRCNGLPYVRGSLLTSTQACSRAMASPRMNNRMQQARGHRWITQSDDSFQDRQRTLDSPSVPWNHYRMNDTTNLARHERRLLLLLKERKTSIRGWWLPFLHHKMNVIVQCFHLLRKPLLDPDV
jgi:hypothetical protein